MALQTITEPQIKRIAFMEDAVLEHISIVDHGANWTPFEFVEQKVDKADQGGVMPGQFIQAILTPESKELEELAADPRYAWLRDVVVNVKRDYGGLRKHQCAKRESFDSIALAPIGDSGAYALVGASKAADNPDLQTITKAPADLIAAMQMPQEEIVARLIDDEMYRFQSILWATLHQEAQVPAKRKAIIMNAMSGLWDFMNSILDAMGPAAVKRQKSSGDGQDIPIDKKEKNMTDTEVQAIVAKAFDEKAAELMAKMETQKSVEKPAVIADVVKGVTDLATIVTEMKGDIKALSEKVVAAEKKVEDVVPERKDAIAVDQVAQLKSQIDALTAQIDTITHSVSTTPPPGDGALASKAQASPGDWTLDMFKKSSL